MSDCGYRFIRYASTVALGPLALELWCLACSLTAWDDVGIGRRMPANKGGAAPTGRNCRQYNDLCGVPQAYRTTEAAGRYFVAEKRKAFRLADRNRI